MREIFAPIWIHPELIFSFSLALLLDLAFGEPPNRFHPIAWLGRLILLLERLAPKEERAQLLYGFILSLLCISFFSLPATFLLGWLKEISSLAFLLGGALFLKISFAVKKLRQEAIKVKKHLEKGELESAKENMPSLVSREVKDLGSEGLVAATVESVAENTCDSFIAPLFYLALAGIPGALIYRAVNALDGTIGYHGKYEYLGKFAARLDDAFNFIPARITGFLLATSALILGKNALNSWKVMLQEHNRTQSPNAGWPISATAGALKVALEKRNCYIIGKADDLLGPSKIKEAVNLMNLTVLLGSLIYLSLGMVCLVFKT